MKNLRRLILILPGVADALPIAYLLVAPVWRSAPLVIVELCSFAPPVVGISVLVALIVLRQRRILPANSDSIRVAIVLAIIGIAEPIFYWI